LFARIVRYQVPTELFDEALDRFGEAGSEIEQLDGFEHGYILADRESALIMSVTLWRDRLALDASDVRAGALRQRAIRAVGGSVECVDRLVVANEIGAGVEA
jgi:heme-degrading monooxygenase HmoA